MKLLRNGADSSLSQKVMRQIDWMQRKLTWRSRGMPDFFIPGVQKGGTTSLFRYLEMHPSVEQVFQKEPHYFCYFLGKGEAWYRAHYPILNSNRNEQGRMLAGDASTHYIFYPDCAQRVFDANNKAKLLILLRDPVDRAYSAWKHSKRKGYESRPFEAVLSEANERTCTESLNAYWKAEKRTQGWANKAYLEHGLYAQQLKPWLDVFPAEQVWIRSSEEFFSDVQGVYASALEFLGLSEWSPADGFPTFNVGLQGEMEKSIEEQLVEYYRVPNEELFELLGVRYAWK